MTIIMAMGTVLLQNPLSLGQVDQLLTEFPQYLFLSLSSDACLQMNEDEWAKVEILFGNRLTPDQLEKAKLLRWIHTPNDDINGLCIEKIRQRANIRISTTATDNATSVGNFVTAATLAFAKQFFHWKDSVNFPALLWDSKWTESMWDLSTKLMLLIDLNNDVGETARQAKQQGMRVWGVREKRSFQPYCDKTIPAKNLHAVLPAADVVVLSLPKDRKYFGWFGAEEIRLLKKDSILIVIGSNRAIDEAALAVTAMQEGRLRGIAIDCYAGTPIAASSPLWKLPNIMITPAIASAPAKESDVDYQTFRYNMRQYIHHNIPDMRNTLNLDNHYLAH